jgi:hypothetical protein
MVFQSFVEEKIENYSKLTAFKIEKTAKKQNFGISFWKIIKILQ